MRERAGKITTLVVLAFVIVAIVVGVNGAKAADSGIPPYQPPAVDMTEGLTPAEQAEADVVHEQWLKSQEGLRPPGEVADINAPDVDFHRPSGGGDGWDINWCRKWWC